MLSSKGSLNVKPTMQLDHPDFSHIFAIGDVANTTAIKAGHTGYYQAGVASENIVRMIKEGEDAKLDTYNPTKPMIKVTVGKVSWSASIPSQLQAHISAFAERGSQPNVERRRNTQDLSQRRYSRRFAS